MIDEKSVYTDKDIQKILGISKSKMQTIRSNNTIPFTKIGRHFYILKRDFEAWLSSNAGKIVSWQIVKDIILPLMLFFLIFIHF